MLKIRFLFSVHYVHLLYILRKNAYFSFKFCNKVATEVVKSIEIEAECVLNVLSTKITLDTPEGSKTRKEFKHKASVNKQPLSGSQDLRLSH